MRFFWLCLWVLVLIAGLFRARQQFLELQEKYLGLLTTAKAPATLVATQEPEPLETWVMPVIQYWDFEAFEQRVHPEIRARIPEGNLKALFEAVAIALGPLREIQGVSLQTPEAGPREGEIEAAIEALFFAGPARLEIRFVQAGGLRWMTDFAVESSQVETIRAAADAAREPERWNPEIFQKKLTA